MFQPGDRVKFAPDPHKDLCGIILAPLTHGLWLVLWESFVIERVHESELRRDDRAPKNPQPQVLYGRHGTGLTYVTGTKQVLVNVHAPNDECFEHFCVIHNPSPEAVAIGYTHWRADRNMMERICEHGVGHPDPDAQAWRERTFGERDDLHGCDGCCSPSPDAA